jgi:hypothetical protein
MKRFGLRTLERVESAEEKNLVGRKSRCLKKYFTTKCAKTVQLTYGGGS